MLHDCHMVKTGTIIDNFIYIHIKWIEKTEIRPPCKCDHASPKNLDEDEETPMQIPVHL